MSLKFPAALKELRIHFSQSGPSSQAVRSFVEKSYPALKQQNPTTPILIRESLGIKPMAYARFQYGQEFKLPLDKANVETTIKSLIEMGV